MTDVFAFSVLVKFVDRLILSNMSAYDIGVIETHHLVRSEKLSNSHRDRSWMGDLPYLNLGVCRQGVQVWPTNTAKLQ